MARDTRRTFDGRSTNRTSSATAMVRPHPIATHQVHPFVPAVGAALCALAWAGVARADPPAPSAELASSDAQPAPATSTAAAAPTAPPARSAPAPEAHRRCTRADYDGRGVQGDPMGDALRWIPRVLFFPLYVVTEYVLRVPIGWTVRELERHHVVERLERIAHPTPGVLLVPTLVVDLGLITSFGLFFAWDHGVNSLRVRASTGGSGYWLFSLMDGVTIAPGAQLALHGDYLERSDWRFYGVGADAQQQNEQLFNWARTEAGVVLRQAVGRHALLELGSGVRLDHFGMPALNPTQDNGVALPSVDDKLAWYERLHAFVDSRGARTPDSSGVRLEGSVQFSADVDRHPARRWLSAELEAAAFLEVAHPGRVLGLRAYGGLVEPFTPEGVPLVDLVTLGGFESMRGWYIGRFRGYTAAVFTASYRYPIWHSLDGTLYAEAGNAFDRGFADFDVRRLHGSLGAGFRTTGDRDSSIDLLFALGTSRFDEPFDVESVRFAVGFNRGF
jgi:hypothetical protein